MSLIQSKAYGFSYAIQLRNHVDHQWADYFAGWRIQNLENGEFLIQKDHVDASELHGILNKICNLNLVIISIKMVSETGDQNNFYNP